MTVDEATEELTQLHKVGLNRLSPGEKKAIALGIEALKRVEKSRSVYSRASIYPLPGETVPSS